MTQELIFIGQVVSAHGVKGELRVIPYSDFPERCYELKNVRLDISGKITCHEVEHARLHGSMWIVKLKKIESREEAGELKGTGLYILPEERVALPPDRYYFDEIIGLEVYTEQGEYLGAVIDILPGGGQDVYVVNGEKEKNNILVPAVKEVIRNVDFEAGRLTVVLPEGLKDI